MMPASPQSSPARVAEAAARVVSVRTMEQLRRVEVVISIRTLLILLGFGVLVLLAILALGLDPPVGRLVKRGWGRGKAALAIFAALFLAVFAIVLVTAGPLWNQIVDFVGELPEYWEELTQKP